jgi:hypothetical protein
MVVTVTEPAVTTTATQSSPILSAPAHSITQSSSLVVVTYTVPGQSGVGVSTYTVTYTKQTSAASSWEPGSVPTTSFTDSTQGQTSGSPSVETNTLGDRPAVTLNATAPLTLTVTPIAVTYTTVQPATPSPTCYSATTTSVPLEEPVFATPQDSAYGPGVRQPTRNRPCELYNHHGDLVLHLANSRHVFEQCHNNLVKPANCGYGDQNASLLCTRVHSAASL